MKYIFSMLSIAIMLSCNSNQKATESMSDNNYFYVGTYTDGSSDGIYKYKLSDDGKLDSIGLVAKSNNPSFLALSNDGSYLVACNEVNTNDGNGTVESYEIENDKLKFVSRSSSGGAHPCFVNVDESGNVLVANYTGGNVGLLKLKENGNLSDLLSVQQHVGAVISDRQDKSHAHSAWFVPNTKEIISVDLGTNELIFSQLLDNDSKLSPVSYKLSMEKGAGPRHLSFHDKGWIYVVNELNSTVSLVLKNDKGIYEIKKSTSTLPDSFKGESNCADIHLSSDGKFLYVSNRGHNSIAVFSVDDNNGDLTAVSHNDVKGNWPRNFALSPDEKFLLVANQKSNNITSFTRNEVTGKLTFVEEIKAPAPVCLLFE